MSGEPRHRLNVDGPFYVVDGCCTLCGIPEQTAPELFGEDEADVHCFVRRQPETPREVVRMLHTIACAEFRCIRYGGDDPKMLRRLAEFGEPELCDTKPPEGVAPLVRDHVTLCLHAEGGALGLLSRLVTTLHGREGSQKLSGDALRATFTAVNDDDPWSITCSAVDIAEKRWLIRSDRPSAIYEQIEELAGDEELRWYTREAWERGDEGNRTLW